MDERNNDYRPGRRAIRHTSNRLGRYAASFSLAGLVFGALFFALSLAPSLLPRNYIVQGLLSGLALVSGYAIGVFLSWLAAYLQLPGPNAFFSKALKWAAGIGVLSIVSYFLWYSTTWQNSIRELMHMEPVVTAYPFRVVAIAVFLGALLGAITRAIRSSSKIVSTRLFRNLPRRLSNILGAALVALLLISLVNGVFARQSLKFADAFFLELDEIIDEGIDQPLDPMASGSAESLIPWDSIGRMGKEFIVGGPGREALARFSNRPAVQPIRVYVGLRSEETVEERAELALEELKRVDAFSRSLLVVAMPTGTGWLDPGAVDTLEFMHHGDTAIVSAQYSYLPSWLTILVDPELPRAAAVSLFDKVYAYWRTLPAEHRPRLYLHGLSLGSLGSETSADLFTLFEDPINGALWSGPPFPSPTWRLVTRGRNPESPAWLPTFRDGAMLRFTSQENTLVSTDHDWGRMRFVYLQYASDPIVFFEPTLVYRRPPWLIGSRGPDVSPYLEWYPVVTFLQIAFDLPMAISVPTGYGHNYAPGNYIDAWIAVTEPAGWSAGDTDRLKELFD